MIKPLKAFLGFCLGLVIIPFYLLLLIVALIAGVLLFAACVLFTLAIPFLTAYGAADK